MFLTSFHFAVLTTIYSFINCIFTNLFQVLPPVEKLHLCATCQIFFISLSSDLWAQEVDQSNNIHNNCTFYILSYSLLCNTMIQSCWWSCLEHYFTNENCRRLNELPDHYLFFDPCWYRAKLFALNTGCQWIESQTLINMGEYRAS